LAVNLKQALAILESNNIVAQGSFLHALHEEDRFDTPSLWTLITAMAVIAETPPSKRGKSVSASAMHVYEQVLLSIIWHYHPHDQASIRGVPGPNLTAYLGRLSWVFTPVIVGLKGRGPWPDFDDGVENPHAAVLASASPGRSRRMVARRITVAPIRRKRARK
jgi:hypothetical protein